MILGLEIKRTQNQNSRTQDDVKCSLSNSKLRDLQRHQPMCIWSQDHAPKHCTWSRPLFVQQTLAVYLGILTVAFNTLKVSS